MAAEGIESGPPGNVAGNSGVQVGGHNFQVNYFGGSSPAVPLAQRLARVRDLGDPFILGVHRALSARAGEEEIPPFVERDLARALADLLDASRFVLVTGESTAGKTRLAYEAMRSRLPGHMLIWPGNKSELPEALVLALDYRQAVVWLDDLEWYLGADGLTPAMLSPVLAAPDHHVVVLATMRASQRASYSPWQGTDGRGEEVRATPQAGKVLELAREVRLDRMWTPAERDRAAQVADTRVARALEHADEFGVAQYLASAPQLFRRWQDARGSAPEGRPRGFALVAAATDARRAGYHHSLPADALRRLHEVQLRRRADRYARLEPWEEALDWATRAAFGTSSLLLPDGEDHYIAFDYLADAVDAAMPIPDIPAAIWDELVSLIPADAAIDVAWIAFSRSRPAVAEAALRKALDAGHAQAALEFAYMEYGTERRSERPEEVLSWLERALTGAGATLAPETQLSIRREMAWWTGARWAGAGDPGKARQLAASVVADSTRILGPRHPITLSSRLALARQVGALGDHQTALSIATDVASIAPPAGDGSGIRRSARFEVAVWTREGGNPRASIREWQALVEDAVSEQATGFLEDIGSIGATVDELGDAELDAAILDWLSDILSRVSERDEANPELVVQLGRILAWWTGGRDDGHGDHASARDLAQQVTDFGTQTLGPDHHQVFAARLVHAHQAGMLGAPARALAASREIVGTAMRIYGPAHRVTADALKEVERWERSDG
jgi:eukaryotic-like serine/threonine-protein kinase